MCPYQKSIKKQSDGILLLYDVNLHRTAPRCGGHPFLLCEADVRNAGVDIRFAESRRYGEKNF
jgi:hypothetical protein